MCIAEREAVSNYKFKDLTQLKGISRDFSKQTDFRWIIFAINDFPKMDPALGQLYTILIKKTFADQI